MNHGGKIMTYGIPTADELISWPRLISYRVLVTPEMAQQWIAAGNVDNRVVRKTVVSRYAAMMAGGEWKPTHQGVAFSARRLIDGQHRLLAVIAAQTAQWMIVFVDQDDETFGTLDRGSARSLRDDLKDTPIHNTDGLSWIARLANVDRSTRAVRPSSVMECMRVFGGIFLILHEIAATNVKGRTNSSIRAAVALRYFEADDAGKVYIEKMWKAWVGSYFADMSASLHSGARRMQQLDGAGGNTAQEERSCVAWIAFDPGARDLKKIIVREKNVTISEMAAVARIAIA